MKTTRKIFCFVVAALFFVAFGIATPTVWAAEKTLTITSFGGSVQKAQRKAFFEPFAKKYGVKILEDEWHGDMAKLRAMVQSGNITWDVLDISGGQLELGCDEGLLEPLDPALLGGEDKFIPGTFSECGVQCLLAGLVIGYDANQFQKGEPKRLEDFWDVKKFPGPRAMKKWPKHNMEFALLADGVAPADVYKTLDTEEGIARAFKKLDQIKPYIKVWFTSWAQSVQLLADGEVAMTTGVNGRLSVTQKTHPNVKFFWDKQLLAGDYWCIVKGAKHKDMAIKFIQFASEPENQAEFPKHILFGVTHKDAFKLMAPELAAQLPSNPINMKNATNLNSRWWSDHNDDLSIRFNAWVTK